MNAHRCLRILLAGQIFLGPASAWAQRRREEPLCHMLSCWAILHPLLQRPDPRDRPLDLRLKLRRKLLDDAGAQYESLKLCRIALQHLQQEGGTVPGDVPCLVHLPGRH